MKQFDHETHDGWVKIRLNGDVTCEMTQKVKGEIDAMVAALPPRPILVCDLADVRFLDSSGIGLLVFLNNKLRQKDGQFIVFQPSEPSRKTLELVQLLAFFTVIESEAELLLHLPG